MLRFLVNRRSNEAILGDLEEEFISTAETQGRHRALLNYWRTIIISIPSFLKNQLCWSATMFKNTLKIVWRNILKSPLTAVISITGLAVGMACFILISLWVRDELSYDTFLEKKDRLYLVTITHPNDIVDFNVPYALPYYLAENFPEISQLTPVYELGNLSSCYLRTTSLEGDTITYYEKNLVLVDPGFFSMFSFPFIHGQPETALTAPNAVILRDKAAEKYFGKENPMGKKLTFNDRQDLVVSGVVHIPENSHIQFDFLSPLEQPLSEDWNWRDQAYVLLENNADVDNLKEKIAGSLNERAPYPLPGTFRVGLMPMTKVHLSFGRRIYVAIFSLIAVFIVAIACVNAMNMSTARAGGRAKEVGLRKVVGAYKRQLVTQFLSESLLTTLLALFLSLFLARLFLPLLNTMSSKTMSLLPLLDHQLLFILGGLTLLVTAGSGIYPAFILSSAKPVNTLKGFRPGRKRRPFLRLATVVGQFTISVLLIACTLVVFKQLTYMRNKPLGFTADSVIRIPINQALKARFLSFKNELLQNPGILNVTAGQAFPFDEDYKTGGVEWRGKDPNMIPNVRYSISHFDYIETFDMEIVEGRSFLKENTSDRYNFVINEEAVRYMGFEHPIGQRLKFWNQEGQVIGVVKNFHHVSLHREIMPQILTINPRFSEALRFIFIKISPENIPGSLAHIQKMSEKWAPGYPYSFAFLDNDLQALYSSEKSLGRIFSVFAVLAIFISCLGIFGLSAYSAEQRTKEIGIRKVLGASSPKILSLLSKDFFLWVLAANIIAWPIAFWAMHKWLQTFAYRTVLNPGVFFLSAVLSFLTAALPIGYQSLKASSADPVKTLKYE